MLIYRPTIISGSGYYSGSFDGDGSRLYNIPSSSYAITASYALNAGGGGGGQKGDKGEMGDSVFTSSLQGTLVTVNHNLDLESHAFETHLHRLRKKINNIFKDNKFVVEKNSKYYLLAK